MMMMMMVFNFQFLTRQQHKTFCQNVFVSFFFFKQAMTRVAKCIQDIQTSNIGSDYRMSPGECLMAAMRIIQLNRWVYESIDIKTTFLQRETFDRQVYLYPPSQVNESQGYLWKLSKCVYRLSDISCTRYLIARQELIKLEAFPLKQDQATFTWYFNDKLHGRHIASLVDDFCLLDLRFLYCCYGPAS